MCDNASISNMHNSNSVTNNNFRYFTYMNRSFKVEYLLFNILKALNIIIYRNKILLHYCVNNAHYQYKYSERNS